MEFSLCLFYIPSSECSASLKKGNIKIQKKGYPVDTPVSLAIISNPLFLYVYNFYHCLYTCIYVMCVHMYIASTFVDGHRFVSILVLTWSS